MSIFSVPPSTPKKHHHLPHDGDDQPSLRRRRHNHDLAEPKKSRKQKQQPVQCSKPPTSWEQLKNLLSCRSLAGSQVHDPSTSKHPKIPSTCSDVCSFKGVASNNTVVARRQTDHDYKTHLLPTRTGSTQQHHTSKGMQLRKLSGCYECRAISEPSRHPMPRTISRCPECGEVFTRPESLEIHQITRHGVSELGPEDSSRNIVEIIFKSSWTKKEISFKIERILKVHNTQRTISRFEGYRDAVKSRAALLFIHQTKAPAVRKNPRCAADGNELLRFYCASLLCSLGSRGSTTLCGAQGCGVCGILRHGFGKWAAAEQGRGVGTTATSGRAHERFGDEAAAGRRRRAMLVCRVIAGRVRKAVEVGDDEGCDSVCAAPANSVSGGGGAIDELFVANPRAILPCFVVVYSTVQGVL